MSSDTRLQAYWALFPIPAFYQASISPKAQGTEVSSLYLFQWSQKRWQDLC